MTDNADVRASLVHADPQTTGTVCPEPDALTGTAVLDDLADWEPLTFAKKKKVLELPRPQALLFDTHAHLRSFWGEDKNPVDVLVRAYQAGVRGLVTLYDPIADKSEETPDAAAFSAWLQGVAGAAAARGAIIPVRYLVGVHPYGAPDYTDAIHAQVEDALADPLCAGVGEIGLDYHFDADDNIEAAPHDLQMHAMARQLELAVRHNVPVELHLRNDNGDDAREAHADAARVLEQVGVPAAGCVLHCFGEDHATMERFVRLGCHIAFGGAATFKRNDDVREAFAACPLDRLLLETDCPYMAPEPIRGLECEPAMIAQTADVLIYDRADRTGELPRDIAQAIWRSSIALFG
ncbi:MAG: TatD family hydrolase [Coriobacteriaceae bacterium]|nr:TatD family hydrolase [Coriobacteriaceae bacterium]